MKSTSLLLGTILSLPLAAHAEENTINIKAGETIELQRAWSTVACKSVTQGPPKIEKLLGPPELSLTVKEAELTPERLSCKVQGAIIYLTASKDVKEPMTSTLVARWFHFSKYGTIPRGRMYKVTITP